MLWLTPQASLEEPSRPEAAPVVTLLLAAILGIDFLWALRQLWSSAPAPGPQFGLLLICLKCALEGFVLLQFWKGRNWARILILLWSLQVSAAALVFLAHHNADPAALMARPLAFLRAALAVFLLWWLNRPPVRGWFKQMSGSADGLLAEHLVGKLCIAVEEDTSAESASAWRILFEHDAALTLYCPWRIVLDGNLAFSSTALASDAPPAASLNPNLERDPARLLRSLRVTALHVAPETSDLVLAFEMGLELQSWSETSPMAQLDVAQLHAAAVQSSAGLAPGPAPQWQFSDPTLSVVAADAPAPLAAASARPASSVS